ncbi:MAG: hypothetical protein QOA12_03625 [Nitrososphaeraceae archaeon]|nr:hypothetical protein [Nitrososphaeraceae archaeon]
MHKGDLITNITDPIAKSMQVLEEQSRAYFNFINSLNSESTRNSYKFCLEKFLSNYKLDLVSLLKLPEHTGDFSDHGTFTELWEGYTGRVSRPKKKKNGSYI